MSENVDVDKEKKAIAMAFRKELNKHGYAFQCAVYEAWREFVKGSMRGFGRWQWAFEAFEFPVAVQGSGTRTDLILKHREKPEYLLVECKRVNPSLAHWGFTHYPEVHRNRPSGNFFLAERYERHEDRCYAEGRRYSTGFHEGYYCHIALELKVPKPGQGARGGRGAIEEAASQACRSLNGMVECFARRSELGQNAVFVPVIFTTAKLWSCEGLALASATDLQTGKVRTSEAITPKEEKWVFYEYHQSPGIKHNLGPIKPGSDPELGSLMDRGYTRTIPIVNASNIAAFLQTFKLDPFAD